MAHLDPIYALGFSSWKKPFVRRFLHGENLQFASSIDQIPAGSRVAAWASGPHAKVLSGASIGVEKLTPVWIEDGFLRSVGLGADLVQPLSWVVDRSGIYYDATKPSDLETLLQKGDFSAELLERGDCLRRSLLISNLTKYNVGNPAWRGLKTRPASSKRIVLVPGQVESDASIRKGAPGIQKNIDLLQAVRDMEPDSWLVYKPHPDVVAGLRAAGAGESQAATLCDEMVTDASMSQVLDLVDAVHVLTSLTGFEALLRGKEVVCHGLPFYAGWGLTKDVWTIPRRTRRLTMTELAAGALIQYPRYVSRLSNLPCAVEQTVAELSEWQRRSEPLSPWRRLIRPILRRP